MVKRWSKYAGPLPFGVQTAIFTSAATAIRSWYRPGSPRGDEGHDAYSGPLGLLG